MVKKIMISKACEKIKHSEIHIYLLSFVLGLAGMFAVLYGSKLVLGEYSLVKGDVMYNYVPAIRNLCRDIINGEDIFYTWTYGLGINTSLYNTYYSFSPVNVLYLIFYNHDMNAVTAACILIKSGLAAACFCFFEKKTYGVQNVYALVFSMCYSLCSYQIAFNVHNFIWMDAMYVLPIVFFFVAKLVDNGKTRGLAFWFAYIFVVHFYMGYMIGIASTMYLFMYAYCRRKSFRETLLLAGRFLSSAGIAIGISAVVWLPTIMFLKDNAVVGEETFAKLKCNLLDVLNQVYWGEVTSFDAFYPYIYCGTAVVILVLAFFLNTNVEKQERIGFGIFLLCLVLSCVCLPVYVVWHGFDEPDLYAFRFSFIISFAMCAVAAIQTKYFGKTGRIGTVAGVAGYICIYIIEMFWQRNRIGEELASNSWIYFVINLSFLAGWIILFAFRGRVHLGGKNIVALFMIVLALVEMVSNGIVILETKGKLNCAFSKEAFDGWDKTEQIVVGALKQDQTFYRVNYLQDMNPSSGSYYGFNSMSYFCSAENVELRETLSKLGLWTSSRTAMCYGLTDATKLLLNVKYDAFNAIPVEGGGYSLGINQNEMIPGLGFVVHCETFEELDIDADNAFENTNHLIGRMAGKEVDIFSRVSEDEIEIVQNGIDMYPQEKGILISRNDNKADATLKYIINTENEGKYYFMVENEKSAYNPNSFYIKDDDESMIYTNGSLGVSYIRELIPCDNGYEIEIGAKAEQEQMVGDMYVYSYDADALAECYDILCQNSISIETYKDGYISGSIETANERNLVYTSIPYDKGWQVYVDGIRTETQPIMNSSFVGVEVRGNGRHNIEMDYEAPGGILGKIVSIMSIGIYILCIIRKED